MTEMISAAIPRQLPPERGDDRRLRHGQAVVMEWLDAQADAEDLEFTECAVRDLLEVGELARAGAGEPILVAAVRRARSSGWGWAPIALLTGVSQHHARRRFAAAID